MSKLVRFGVSLDLDLLEEFDAFCAKNDYASRSEALRDIIREKLLQDESASAVAKDYPATGVLSMVYDHHSHDLSRQLTGKQHSTHEHVIATLHVHLDRHNCLEVLILKGSAKKISHLAASLRAIKGVKHGTFVLAKTDDFADN